jgi:hypothetical protein
MLVFVEKKGQDKLKYSVRLNSSDKTRTQNGHLSVIKGIPTLSIIG